MKSKYSEITFFVVVIAAARNNKAWEFLATLQKAIRIIFSQDFKMNLEFIKKRIVLNINFHFATNKKKYGC